MKIPKQKNADDAIVPDAEAAMRRLEEGVRHILGVPKRQSKTGHKRRRKK
jgi:hypothetical protein